MSTYNHFCRVPTKICLLVSTKYAYLITIGFSYLQCPKLCFILEFFKEEKCNTLESVIILTKYLLKSNEYFMHVYISIIFIISCV